MDLLFLSLLLYTSIQLIIYANPDQLDLRKRTLLAHTHTTAYYQSEFLFFLSLFPWQVFYMHVYSIDAAAQLGSTKYLPLSRKIWFSCVVRTNWGGHAELFRTGKGGKFEFDTDLSVHQWAGTNVSQIKIKHLI